MRNEITTIYLSHLTVCLNLPDLLSVLPSGHRAICYVPTNMPLLYSWFKDRITATRKLRDCGGLLPCPAMCTFHCPLN